MKKKKIIKNKPIKKEMLKDTLININGISAKLTKSDIKKLRKANNSKRKGPKSIPNSSKMIIETKNVTKSYISGSIATNALKGIDLAIPSGDFVLIFGKSGSGKSTLLNLISGLDRATSGEIIVNNKVLQNLSNKELTTFRRKDLSFIFQSYNLLQNLNARDNVDTGAFLQKNKNRKLNIEKLFLDLDLIEVINKYPSQMSGGQQQRISILRALAKNPTIIFADEPTGALDKKTSLIVLQVLKDINKKYGTTIIMVSHDYDIARICKRIIKLVDGKIESITINKKPDSIHSLGNFK